jgi:hypothetical protein
MTYCTDTNLLSFEPWIFRDAAFASQLLASGSGQLAGTLFTRNAGSFVDDHVIPGGVITLQGDMIGCYPIVSVDGPAQLTASTFHDGLFTDDGTLVASPIGSAASIAFSIRTFHPQRQIISDLIRQAARVGEGTDLPGAVILPSASLRNTAALGAFHLIYCALAAASSDPAELSRRADYYERLYRRALTRLRVEIDTDGDGEGNLVRPLAITDLVRA